MSEERICTVIGEHGLQPGDTFVVTSKPRLKRIVEMLRRPRIQVVTSTTPSSFSWVERRPTWREWRTAISRDLWG